MTYQSNKNLVSLSDSKKKKKIKRNFVAFIKKL